MDLEEATIKALNEELNKSKDEVLKALELVKQYNDEIGLDTLTGEEGSDIVEELGIEDEAIENAFNLIIEHLWIYYPDDEEWSTYSSLDEPPKDATIKEFDTDEYGYSKIATDVPEIFEIFKE